MWAVPVLNGNANKDCCCCCCCFFHGNFCGINCRCKYLTVDFSLLVLDLFFHKCLSIYLNHQIACDMGSLTSTVFDSFCV